MSRPLQFYRSRKMLDAAMATQNQDNLFDEVSAQNHDCTHKSLELLEPQPSTSFASQPHCYKRNHSNGDLPSDYIHESAELITPSDLDDSVEDPDFILSDKDANSDSTDSDDESCLRDLICNNNASLTMIDSHENLNMRNTTATFTDKRIDVENTIYIAKYPAPIYINSAPSAEQQQSSVDEIQETINPRILKNKLKHPMKTNPCEGKCKRQCNFLSENDRKCIWTQYWDKNYASRRSFLNKCVRFSNVKRRKLQHADSDGNYLKKESRYFFLPKNDGELVSVCRNFFLGTLGYKTDGVITELSKAIKKDRLYAVVSKDRRGKKADKKIDRKIIKDHILSFNPTSSHYRRHNSPHTKYLPRHLTLKIMYNDFKSKHPNFKCGKEVYRQQLKDLRLSFHMPKGDQCPECLIYEEEMKVDENAIPIEMKEKHERHKLKAESAIQRYRLDGEAATAAENNLVKYFSMDLQKVVILPIMPAIKDAFFMSRLVTFNLTFAPIQKQSKNIKATCVLWHEGKAGRDATNIVDAIVAFLESYRDAHHFYIWADNCTAQNKNWTLYTALTMIVNNSGNNIQSITMGYLTKGHTHMSADSVHANIELKMRRQRNVYDFQDFKDIVMASRSNIRVLELEKVQDWPKKKRVPRPNEPLKDFNLNSVVEVKFVAGSRNLLYKTRFDSQFTELDFMMKRFDVCIVPKLIPDPRGVSTQKKEEIVKKLVPLMPESRRNFWYNLPTNDKSLDLSYQQQPNSGD